MALLIIMQFQAEGTEGHSSSIVDLFDSLRSPINFLDELQWTDELQEARFFTSLSRVSHYAIDSTNSFGSYLGC